MSDSTHHHLQSGENVGQVPQSTPQAQPMHPYSTYGYSQQPSMGPSVQHGYYTHETQPRVPGASPAISIPMSYNPNVPQQSGMIGSDMINSTSPGTINASGANISQQRPPSFMPVHPSSVQQHAHPSIIYHQSRPMSVGSQVVYQPQQHMHRPSMPTQYREHYVTIPSNTNAPQHQGSAFMNIPSGRQIPHTSGSRMQAAYYIPSQPNANAPTIHANLQSSHQTHPNSTVSNVSTSCTYYPAMPNVSQRPLMSTMMPQAAPPGSSQRMPDPSSKPTSSNQGPQQNIKDPSADGNNAQNAHPNVSAGTQPASAKALSGLFALDENDMQRVKEIHSRIEQYVQIQRNNIQQPDFRPFSTLRDAIDRLLPYHLLDLFYPSHGPLGTNASRCDKDSDIELRRKRQGDLEERSKRLLSQVSLALSPSKTSIGIVPEVPREVSILHTRIGLQLEREALQLLNSEANANPPALMVHSQHQSPTMTTQRPPQYYQQKTSNNPIIVTTPSPGYSHTMQAGPYTGQAYPYRHQQPK
jgi:hypothetical protein